MRKQILIVGAGFAGMWAALSAARLAEKNQQQAIDITVIAPQPELRVRPRFYESDVPSLVAPLQPLFDATGIRFLRGSVSQIHPADKTVTWTGSNGESHTQNWDRLVLASGSHVNRAMVTGAAQHAFDLDQLESATTLENHLIALAQRPQSDARNTVVVCGGGFTGIEMAMELPTKLRAIFGSNAKTRVVDTAMRCVKSSFRPQKNWASSGLLMLKWRASMPLA